MKIPCVSKPTVLALCLGFGFAHADPITLQTALTMAAQNIDTKISQRQLQGARADVLAANHAPLPVLSTSISQIDLKNGVGAGAWLGEKRVDTNIGVDWTWERGDKRILRTQSAESFARASQSDLLETIIQQRLGAQSAFFDVLANQERVAQFTALQTSAQSLSDAGLKRLKAGDISAQEAARSDIEARRAGNDLLAAQQDLNNARLTLSLILNSPDSKLQAQHAHNPTSTAVTSFAYDIEQRPDVLAAVARVQAAEAQSKNALALKKNDITVGTAIDSLPGTSTRMMTVRMSMPLQLGGLGGYTFQGEIGRAQAQLDTALALLDKTRQAAAVDEQRMMRELQAQTKRAASYTQDIEPQAKKVAEQAELAYSKGALSLSDLLDARRTYRLTSLDAIAAQSDFEKALAAWNIRHDKN